MAKAIMHDDIFEYITTHISIYDYDKLRKVSVKFNRVFNLNFKDSSQIIQSIGNDKIIKFIEGKVINNYKSSIIKSKVANRYLLFEYWHEECWVSLSYELEYAKVTEHFMRIINLNNGIYIKSGMMYIEYLIALLHNSESMDYKNIVNILECVYNHAEICPLKGVTDIKRACTHMYNIRIKYGNRINCRFKKSYKNMLYKINLNAYVVIIAKSYYTYKTVNYKSKPPKFNELWLVEINNIIDTYKDILKTNTQISNVFPKYYIKFVLKILDDCYVG